MEAAGGGGRAAADRVYLVDTLAGDPKFLQADAEMYYEKLLKKSSSTPDILSIPGGEKVKLEDSCVCFVPLYRNNPACKMLLLTDPRDKETVLAVYLNQSWWLIEDVIKTADPSRDGLILVQTFAERIVLFVLNYVIFGMLEGSSANDAFFLPHSATECAKILWRDGEAAAFYTVKMKEILRGETGRDWLPVVEGVIPILLCDSLPSEGLKMAPGHMLRGKRSLCDDVTSQCYLLPVLDTIFVQRKYRRGGLGMKMLHDFCQSFVAEDALGISCPISAAMYQVCQKFLQIYPEEQNRLWEVEAPGDWSQRVNIWLKLQMESALSERKAIHLISPEDEEGSQVEYAQSSKLRQLDADHMSTGIEYISGVGRAAEDTIENKDDAAAAAASIQNPRGPAQKDLE